jgi:hypothetical protein
MCLPLHQLVVRLIWCLRLRNPISRCRVTTALKIPGEGKKADWPDTPTLEKCKRLVARINMSSTLRHRLHELQQKAIDEANKKKAIAKGPKGPLPLLGEDVGVDDPEDNLGTPLKMVKYVITRWSSAYMMMDRILKLRVYLVPLLQSELREIQISFKVVADLVRLLKPFYLATQDLQGEFYPTLSRVWYHLDHLRYHTEHFESKEQEVIDVRNRLLAEMDSDRALLRMDAFGMYATVLDPTQKVRRWMS